MYRRHRQEYLKISRQARNISDNDADMETLKNGIERILDEVNVIRLSSYFTYHDSKKLTKKVNPRKSMFE